MAALLTVALNTYNEDTDLPPTEGILKIMNEPLVPLSVLALDLDTNSTALANKLANRVLLDDLGRPAIDRPIARQLIAEKTAADRAAHERAQRRTAEYKARIAEISARNRATVRRGVPAVSGNAFADMMAVDQQ